MEENSNKNSIIFLKNSLTLWDEEQGICLINVSIKVLIGGWRSRGCFEWAGQGGFFVDSLGWRPKVNQSSELERSGNRAGRNVSKWSCVYLNKVEKEQGRMISNGVLRGTKLKTIIFGSCRLWRHNTLISFSLLCYFGTLLLWGLTILRLPFLRTLYRYINGTFGYIRVPDVS